MKTLVGIIWFAYLIVLVIGILGGLIALGILDWGEAANYKFDRFGIAMQGMGTYLIAAGGVTGGIWAIKLYKEQRESSNISRDRQNALDVVKLQSELIQSLQEHLKILENDYEIENMKQNIEKAINVQRTFIDGLIKQTQELSETIEDAISREMRTLEREISGTHE